MSENQFVNVHTLDGQLRGIFQSTACYTLVQKEKLFRELIAKLSEPAAIYAVETIIQDLSHPLGGANFQPANNTDSSDILADILGNQDYEDLLPILSEQLADAKNLGLCDSGRVTRLLQVWLAQKKK